MGVTEYLSSCNFVMIQLSCLVSAGYDDGSMEAYLNLSLFEERVKIAKVANHTSHEPQVFSKMISCMFNTIFIIHMYVLIIHHKFLLLVCLSKNEIY
jgi:hypothetical protein